MNKKKTIHKTPPVAASSKRGAKRDYAWLLKTIESANTQMVSRATAVVNQALLFRNWLVGAYLVDFEQSGSDRAKYGDKLLATLASDLAARKVAGFSISALERCRRFYLAAPQLSTMIPSTVLTELTDTATFGIPSTMLMKSPKATGVDLPTPLMPEQIIRLSWSKWIELVRIDDPWKRAFYENECLKGNWSVRQLQRQIESLLYERTGLSRNKQAVIERARRQAHETPSETVSDLIRDPYVLEFTGLAERPEYSESDLETTLLDHLQRFLLELGAGFCFEARQFRITVNNKHDRVDLVFYHRRLRCHVLLDLKTRAFRHTDVGQMNFYLNWFKANVMDEGDNPPVGIILCSDRDGTEVEFATAGMDNKLFVSRYLTALPSAEQLKALVEGDRARLAAPAPKIKKTETK
ncbi:MAG: DUF1016 family protein [Verrucomicrobia bacterium]|nr:DUF1016 family protein [Verrucomicrobiota bacterium]